VKAIFLLSEKPFPARNGITIPTSNHIQIARGMGVDVKIACPHYDVDEKENYCFISFVKMSSVKKLLNELVFWRYPYFTKTLAPGAITQILHDCGPIDCIYYSPISMHYAAYEVSEMIFKESGYRPKVIASVSDCYTAVLREGLKSKRRMISVKGLVNYIRSYYLSVYERKIYEKSDKVIVQTAADKKWTERIGVKPSKIVVIPNGVNDSLFDVTPSESFDFVFVGNFNSEFYVNKFCWFYNDVWSRLIISNKNIKLHVYTSGNRCERVLSQTKNDSTVRVYSHFVEKIADVYDGKTYCIAPIFKNYGFINKVAEAMASGLLVFGDRSAFNGMDVTDGVQCLIAESSDDFIAKIQLAISDSHLTRRISNNAKVFALNNFSWESRKMLLARCFS
jgi:glycosyltransferase involved in cell wall biosynthesis